MRVMKRTLIPVALLLTACGGNAAPAGSPASVAPQPSTAASANAAAGGTIKIGYLAPFTGPTAAVGKNNRLGVDLYLSTVNSTIAGRKVEVLFEDTQNQADVALTKAKNLVENNKVQFLMGINLTPECYAVAGYVKQAQVALLITANCAAETVTTDPKFKSPYLVRLTYNATQEVDPAADWAYKQGYRKAILIASDYGGGLENADTFASAFIKRGGAVVQELYPALGTPDFGPFLAQLTNDADVMFCFLPGTDGLHFLEQLANYRGQQKTAIIDAHAVMTDSNMDQLKDKAVGVYAANEYSTGLATPENQTFRKAFAAKYPSEPLTATVAYSYSGMQMMAAAVQKMNGNVEQVQPFLQALYDTNAATAKGPIKLDADHDAVQNVYVYQIVKDGAGFGQKLLTTYEAVSRNWDRSPAEIDKFPFGKMKNKWVGMTKDKLGQLTT